MLIVLQEHPSPPTAVICKYLYLIGWSVDKTEKYLYNQDASTTAPNTTFTGWKDKA
ncbi:hypothetical protein E2C01_029456 [Portunus trituberculatus]|uniref:Uncharacterized protein n=1 Tax=Portunus trituberculatus TaxID=210409 RepID=A0A5B7ESZ3_PORTR|nr:hypothetical protein [Portunus trituberculatus]